MASIGRCVVAALVFGCLSSACTGDDDSCEFGQGVRCEEHNGPIEVKYCQPDGVWSECVLAVECNPLTQDGCEDGLACYFEATYTFCAAPDTYPCEPGQFAGSSRCRRFCEHDGRQGYIWNPPDCEPGDVCGRDTALPEGVGQCVTFTEDV